MDGKPSRKRVALLVLRAQAGDRDAMDRLLELHQNQLLGYLSKMLRDRTDAEDALQATSLQVVRKITWLREPLYFRSWAFRIASRFAFDIIRKQKRNLVFSDSEFIEGAPDPEFDDAEKDDLVDSIPQWLEKLTPNGREVLILHYLEGFTTEQVAEILGIPLGTAKSRISYSLTCIRNQLSVTERVRI